MKRAYIYFENGLFFEAQSFGSEGSCVGEVVFNTAMSGYQEVITDPSHAGQFIAFTMPEAGIVGVNPQDMESHGAFCKGILVKRYNDCPSNFRAKESLGDFLKAHGVMGITGIPTRYLTRIIRQEGAMMMIASTEISAKEQLKELLEDSPRIQEINYIREVSTKESYLHTQGLFDLNTMKYTSPGTFCKVVAIDFGIKRNILSELVNAGMQVEVIPHAFEPSELIQRYKKGEIGGVFLSNGPGDPAVLEQEVTKIKELINADIPIFAICLGHQLLALAHGFSTHKLKFGHHGSNHPVKNLSNGVVEITAQNCNYFVSKDITQVAEITHKNLFDGTIEGLKYKKGQMFSVQHYPKVSPRPHESRGVFEEFAKITQKPTK